MKLSEKRKAHKQDMMDLIVLANSLPLSLDPEDLRRAESLREVLKELWMTLMQLWMTLSRIQQKANHLVASLAVGCEDDEEPAKKPSRKRSKASPKL